VEISAVVAFMDSGVVSEFIVVVTSRQSKIRIRRKGIPDLLDFAGGREVACDRRVSLYQERRILESASQTTSARSRKCG